MHERYTLNTITGYQSFIISREQLPPHLKCEHYKLLRTASNQKKETLNFVAPLNVIKINREFLEIAGGTRPNQGLSLYNYFKLVTPSL
jgi:hypothetical protein